jgi:hypothetical protein
MTVIMQIEELIEECCGSPRETGERFVGCVCVEGERYISTFHQEMFNSIYVRYHMAGSIISFLEEK